MIGVGIKKDGKNEKINLKHKVLKEVKMAEKIQIKPLVGKGSMLFLAVMLLIAIPLRGQAADNFEKKLQVYTVNYPLAYFAQRIGGEHVDVFFPGPPNEDPAYWMPDSKTIDKYQKADLILLNGANYAKWVAKVSLPQSKMADTSKRFKDRYIYTKEAVTHSHGPQGKHAHENLAFTTWLDFSLAAEQAKAVQHAMGRKRPGLASEFQENFNLLYLELTAIDTQLKQIVSSNPERPLVVSHPVYDYLAQGYGMNIESLHWEPDQILDPAHWKGLKTILSDHPAKWLVWEAPPIKETVGQLETMGLKSVAVSPCACRPEKGDFMTVMHQNLENIKSVYE
jgi:zinc transport system substrate-binding protein